MLRIGKKAAFQKAHSHLNGTEKLLSFRKISDSISFFINQIVILLGLQMWLLNKIDSEKITIKVRRYTAVIEIDINKLSVDEKTFLAARSFGLLNNPLDFELIDSFKIRTDGFIRIKSKYLTNLRRPNEIRDHRIHRLSSASEPSITPPSSPSLLDPNWYN